ncbi:MAG: hypothetical protein AAFP97_12530 [Pseudomonadota bacterium]
MKHLLIAAMAGALVACGGGSGGEVTPDSAAKMSPIKLAESIADNMTRAAEMVNSIQSVADAEAIKPELAEIGNQYTVQVTAMRSLDQSKIKDPEAFMQKQMESANALAGFMSAMQDLQARNVDAATAIMPELRAFQPS